MKPAIHHIIECIKERILNDDRFNSIYIDESLRIKGEILQIGENEIEYNFVATKKDTRSLTDLYRVQIDSIHIVSMPNENCIERKNIINEINKLLN